MTVLFYLNRSLAGTDAVAEKAKEILRETGVEITEDIKSKYEYAVVFGGDGTILSAVKDIGKTVPIIGVNTGNLGYLTAFGASNLDVLRNIGRLTFQKHSVIECRKNGERLGFCLNDFTLCRDFEGGICDISAAISGNVFEYRADGVILSTATGSTAYGFSAGGPIVEHDAEYNVLTPICPHSGLSRSMVISAEREIVIKANSRQSMYLLCDGKKICDVGNDDEIVFKPGLNAVFLADGGQDFFSVVKNKLI